MAVAVGDALLAGAAGGVVMLAVAAVPAAAGRALPLDVTRFWRGVAGRTLLGLLGHLVLSAAVGMLYAVVLDAFDASASVPWGLTLGAVHAAAALTLLPALVGWFPSTVEVGTTLGRLGAGLGALALVTAVVAHLAYGVTAVLVYRELAA